MLAYQKVTFRKLVSCSLILKGFDLAGLTTISITQSNERKKNRFNCNQSRTDTIKSTLWNMNGMYPVAGHASSVCTAHRKSSDIWLCISIKIHVNNHYIEYKNNLLFNWFVKQVNVWQLLRIDFRWIFSLHGNTVCRSDIMCIFCWKQKRLNNKYFKKTILSVLLN